MCQGYLNGCRGKRRDILTVDREQQQQSVLKCSRGVSNGMQTSESKYISSPTDVRGWWTLPALQTWKGISQTF